MSTIRALLARGRDALVLAEVDTPMLDAAVLLAHAMGSTMERLLASLPDEADEELARRYDGLLDERRAGRPVSYIRRLEEFWGLEFHVDVNLLYRQRQFHYLGKTYICVTARFLGSASPP